MEDADISALHRNLGLRDCRPLVTGGGTGRSTARRAVFKEAQTLCERDSGRLWGVSLCGPMVIADAATGTIATSQPAPAGDRPRVIGFVNAPVEWGGVTWSAYNWQMIPKDDQGERGRLFMHELFHCIQPRLGLLAMRDPSAGENSHLDSLDGRYWMRLVGGPWRGRLAPLARRARPPLRMRWRFARRASSAFPVPRRRSTSSTSTRGSQPTRNT